MSEAAGVTTARPSWLPWTTPVLLWLWLFQHLHYDWSLHEQYNYGWAVPFLAALLFFQRWGSRPLPDGSFATRALSTATGWALLFLLLPVRVVQEANPDWRLLSWIFGLMVVAYTLLAIGRAGGGAWLRHFAFPVCFPLVAIPWLVQMENAVVQSLTAAVAAAAVEIASWSGIGAYQAGNVIQLGNGFVGVDEACSGVKTLQAAIMVSLFIGELLYLTTARRIALVLGGCAWVFACNIARATALVVIAARSGLPEMQEWHDFIGSVVLIAGMGGLLVLAALLMRRQGAPAPKPPQDKRASVEGAPPWAALLPVAWLVLVFGATELWYRLHERQLLVRPAWSVAWPAGDGAREMPIADATRAILRYNTATSAAWQTPAAANSWWGFFARWEPGRAAVQLVRSHSPEICLPAIGRTFVRELAPVEWNDGGLQLRFRSYEFVQESQPLFVFVCIQEDKKGPRADDPALLEWSARGRLRAALAGQRNLGQRLLELAAIGFPNAEEATRGLLEATREIVRPAATD